MELPVHILMIALWGQVASGQGSSTVILECSNQNNGKCVAFFSQEPVSRVEASNECKKRGASLPCPEDYDRLRKKGNLYDMAWTALSLNDSTKPPSLFWDTGNAHEYSCAEGTEVFESFRKEILGLESTMLKEKCPIRFTYRHYLDMTDCGKVLHYVCIKDYGTREHFSSNIPFENKTLLIDQENYKILNVSCSDLKPLRLVLGNFKMEEEGHWFVPSMTISWSRILKNGILNIFCPRNGRNPYIIRPIRSLRFTKKTGVDECLNDTKLYQRVEKEFGLTEFQDVKVKCSSDRQSLILTSTNESQLSNVANKVLKVDDYTPQFCPSQSRSVGFGNVITWNISFPGERIASHPFSCLRNDASPMIRKCEKKNDAYELSAFSERECSRLSLCPIQYKAIAGTLCVQDIFVDSFESLFKGSTGAEINIFKLYENSKEKYEYLNASVQSQGYQEVFLPIRRMTEYGQFAYFETSSSGKEIKEIPEDFSWQEGFPNADDMFVILNIRNSSLRSSKRYDLKIPALRVIDFENVLALPAEANVLREQRILENSSACLESGSLYLRHSGTCLSIRNLEDASWEEANNFCADENMSLPVVRDTITSLIYQQLLVEHGVQFIWLRNEANLFPSENEDHLHVDPSFPCLTQSGVEFVEEGRLSQHVLCEARTQINSKLTYLELSYVGKNFCLKINPTVPNLKTHPRCFCSWAQEIKVFKSSEEYCNYEFGKVNSPGYCQCSAIVLHSEKQGLVLSNKLAVPEPTEARIILNFTMPHDSQFLRNIESSRSHNIFNQSQTSKELTQILKSNYSVLEDTINECQSSAQLLDKQNEGAKHQTTILLLLTCPSFDDEMALYRYFMESNNSPDVGIKFAEGCPEETHNNLTWSKTKKAGRFEPKEICLSNHSLPVLRHCKGDEIHGFTWEPFNETCGIDSENLSNTSRSLIDILKDDAIPNKIVQLDKILEEKELSPFGILTLSRIFNSSVVRQSNASVETVTNIVGNALDIVTNKKSPIIELNKNFNSASKILNGFDQFLINQISDNLNENQSFQLQQGENLFLAIKTLPLLADGTENIIEVNHSDNISLISTNEESNNKDVDVLFYIPKGLSKHFKNIPLIYKHWLNDVLFQDDSLPPNTKVCGPIADIVIVNTTSRSAIKTLESNIKIKITATRKMGIYACVSWDLSSGKWTTKGCRTKHEDSFATCTCTHLTHFALLFKHEIPDHLAGILDILAYCGFFASLASLFIVISSRFLLKSWAKGNDTEGKILLNLSLALLSSFIVMIVGRYLQLEPVWCELSALALQYLLLSLFAWSSSEAAFKYMVFVKGWLSIRCEEHFRKLFIFSWGVPCIYILLIKLIMLMVKKEIKWRSDYCWIPNDEFAIGFIAPLSTSVGLNICVLICIVYKMFNEKAKKLKSTMNKQRVLKRKIIETFSLAIMFGISWILGPTLTVIDGAHEAGYTLAFVFTTLQSLQGVFILIRISSNNNFRNNWKDFITELQGRRSIGNRPLIVNVRKQ